MLFLGLLKKAGAPPWVQTWASQLPEKGPQGTHDPSPFLQQPHAHVAYEKDRVMDAPAHWLCPGDRGGLSSLAASFQAA